MTMDELAAYRRMEQRCVGLRNAGIDAALETGEYNSYRVTLGERRISRRMLATRLEEWLDGFCTALFEYGMWAPEQPVEAAASK